MKTNSAAAEWSLAVIVLLFVAQAGLAAPAHVIRFVAAGPTVGCNMVVWRDVLTLYNSSTKSLTVRVLGISNGGALRTDPDGFEVPPGTVVSVEEALLGAWVPRNGAPLWIMHLDIPEGIVLESRNEIAAVYMCASSPVPQGSAGKTSLPVFRAAVAANEPQVYLGTDVGSRDARINVGIYNQGEVTASAHIEVRRECDNSVVDSRDVLVPADTVMQFGGFTKGVDTCGAIATTSSHLRYTVITVDQPSMTYAAALTDKLFGLTSPEIGITLPTNARF